MSKRFATALFAIGLLVTTVMAVITIWPDYEASTYQTTFRGDDDAALRCPMAIKAGETVEMSAKLTNTQDRRLRFVGLSFVTPGNTTLPRETREEVYLESGQSDVITWQADESDVVFDRMILNRFYSFRSSRVPSADGACGVWYFGGAWAQAVPLSGQGIYWLFSAVGLIALIVGGVGASGAGNPLAIIDKSTDRPRLGPVLAIAALGAYVMGLVANPLIGVLALVAGLLIMFALIDRAVS